MRDSPAEQPLAESTAPPNDPAEQLCQLWHQGQRPDVDVFLADAGPLSPTQMAAVLRTDQRERWPSGERIAAEAYLQRYPEVQADREAAVDLIHGEFLLRERYGERPSLDEYLRRFPEHADLLRGQIELHLALALAAGLDSANVVWPSQQATAAEALGPAPAAPAGRAWPTVTGYDILAELGRGGMGIVYKAQDRRLKRTVALKMLLAGSLADREQLARFRVEAEAVARLQHPHIVQIYEVGEQDGRPFFALEYVEGGSLDKHLAGTPQPSRTAAPLVETLAWAVHAAHQRGIVHRDLKPANVLLEIKNPESAIYNLQSAIPKITDFGLAKQLDADPMQTPSGVILGTPSYMAPEQATGKVHRIGPATDVYALGAILYEMLTGRPPFKGETALDTVTQVLHDEPVPPRRLQPKVPADLETICLKCLQKDSGKRYTSAEALAEDLRRFRAGEPIRARPVGPARRLWRWCQRKPALASLAAALIVVVVSALACVTGFWLRAEGLRAEAEADFQLALESVDQYATRVSENLRLREEDLRPLRKELLETVVPFYEKLIARHSDRADVQAERGRAYARLADLVKEIADPVKASELYEQAVAVFEDLAGRHPSVSDYRLQLARIRDHLSEAYERTGRNAEAEAGCQEGLKIWEGLIQEQPAVDYRVGLARARIRLAGLYARTGRIPLAQAEYQRALQIREELEHEHVNLSAEQQQTFALGHQSLGLLCQRTGQLAEAEVELGRTLHILEQLARQQPQLSDYQHKLAGIRSRLGALYEADGRLSEAGAERQKALAISEQLVRQHPSVLDYLESLAEYRHALTTFHVSTQESPLMVAEFQKAQEMVASLARQQPQVIGYQERLARIHFNLSVLLRSLGRSPEAGAEAKKSLTILETLVAQQPEVDSYKNDFANTDNLLGVLYLEARQLGEAEAAFQKALAIGRPLVRQLPSIGKYQEDLSIYLLHLGMLYYDTDRKAQSEMALREALELKRSLAEQQPRVLTYQVGAAKNHNNLAVLYVATGRHEQAAAEYRQALEIVERLVHEQPDVTEYAVMLGGYHTNLAILLQKTGKVEAAVATHAQAIRTLEGVLQKEPQHAPAKIWLCSAHRDRALALRELDRYAEAIHDWDLALALDNGRRGDMIRALRAEAMACMGDHARAMAEVQTIAQNKSIELRNFYRLAWACSAASVAAQKDANLPPDEREKWAEQYAAYGVDQLLKGEAAGYFKQAGRVEEFKTDRHLDPLRPQADFQKLLQRLQIEEAPQSKSGKVN
jgi:tetratricopeptide (TPR) repeat protein/tRNA A-37 threonylcarbamoyl transferase component Bud32